MEVTVSGTWLWIIGLGLAVVMAIAFALRTRSHPTWGALSPWIAGTVIGSAASVATYLWVFERAACAGVGDFACMLNENQGVLTFLATILAVGGLWTAAIYREADRRRARRDLEGRAKDVLVAAVEEVRHNLVHVALVYDEGTLLAIPQLSMDEISRLSEPEFRPLIDQRVLKAARAMRRNYEALLAEEGDLDAAEWPLESLVNQSLRLLLAAAAHHGEWAASVLTRPAMQDIQNLAARKTSVYFAFRSSRAERDAADLRSREIPVLCWWDDAAPEKVEVFPQWQRFFDMNHRH